MGHYSKYNVAREEDRTMDGIIFASKMEMNRYWELKLLQKAGEIKFLVLQPKFVLFPKQNKLSEITYTPDFQYIEIKTGASVIEEVKGFATRDYKLRANLFARLFPRFDYRVIKK